MGKKKAAICGAKTRQGRPCQQKAGWGTDHVGQGRCKLHGGKSLRGRASATWTDGRRAKREVLPIIDPVRWETFQQEFDATNIEQNLALVAFVADTLLEKGDIIRCPECEADVPIPRPHAEWARYMDILLKSQTALLRARDKIIVQRVIDESVVMPTLKLFVGIIAEHVSGETYDNIVRELEKAAESRGGDDAG